LKKILKNILPPIVIEFIKSFIYSKRIIKTKFWAEATKKSKGYNHKIIFDKVYEASKNVLEGKYPYERDGVNFGQIEYSWPLLSGLLLSANLNNGYLNVCDFGGSLGSSYFQNRSFINRVKKVHWNIIEQSHFVETGKNEFENNFLKFYYSLYEFSQENKPQTLLLSSVLQYIEHPYDLLDKILAYDFKIVILDRTPFDKNNGNEFVMLQKVPKEIYDASYPAWVFNAQKMSNFILDKDFKLLETFDSNDKNNLNFYYGGLIFIKN
jgi:putative methyltransferase (TIGR04325 family)